jgi:Domain of unknown function (DUF4440)
MRSLALALVVAGLVPTAAAAQSASTSDAAGYRASPASAPIATPRTEARAAAERELRTLLAWWPEALARRDLAFFDQLLASDYRGLGGPTDETKAGFLAALARTTPRAQAAFRIDSVGVRFLGPDDGTAVLAGYLTDRDPRTGEFSGPRVMFTEVLERRDGRWQVVHGHLSWIVQ